MPGTMTKPKFLDFSSNFSVPFRSSAAKRKQGETNDSSVTSPYPSALSRIAHNKVAMSIHALDKRD